MHSKVSDEDNELLTHPFTKEEFKEAIFSMHPDKSSGPNGLNPAFFQRFWNEIHSDVYSSAFFWLDSSSLPPELNATNIVLAPKGDNPK